METHSPSKRDTELGCACQKNPLRHSTETRRNAHALCGRELKYLPREASSAHERSRRRGSRPRTFARFHVRFSAAPLRDIEPRINKFILIRRIRDLSDVYSLTDCFRLKPVFSGSSECQPFFSLSAKNRFFLCDLQPFGIISCSYR